MIEDAEIMFRNFAGQVTPFNDKGKREFGVRLDEETALKMLADGWNIKYLKPRDEDDDEERPWIPVEVSFKNKPPQIYMIADRGSSKVRTKLDQETIDILDIVEISSVDLILNPYEWEVNGKGGIKAYLKSLYVTIREDRFQRKHGILEDLPSADGD
jgi:hypothetical protein